MLHNVQNMQRRLDTVMWHIVHACVSEFMRSLYGGFCTEKTIRTFSEFFSITPKELVSFESASGVESEYPVNPVQPLGHFGCRAAWKSEMAEKPGKQGAYVLRRCLQPSAPCGDVDHGAGFKVLGVYVGSFTLGPRPYWHGNEAVEVGM